MFDFTRRSATLRTYAGDTSLPGGKWDSEDKNLDETAVRSPLSLDYFVLFNSLPSAGRLSKKYIYLIRSERKKTKIFLIDWSSKRQEEGSSSLHT